MFQITCKGYCAPIRQESDEICDLVVDKEAIDTKYRIGSGDSGTLKKFRQYGKRLQDLGLTPVVLILRNDNLGAAIAACQSGGWKVYIGDASFEYIIEKTGFDLKKWLKTKKDLYKVKYSSDSKR